jgi:hypothetical protein
MKKQSFEVHCETRKMPAKCSITTRTLRVQVRGVGLGRSSGGSGRHGSQIGSGDSSHHGSSGVRLSEVLACQWRLPPCQTLPCQCHWRLRRGNRVYLHAMPNIELNLAPVAQNNTVLLYPRSLQRQASRLSFIFFHDNGNLCQEYFNGHGNLS